MTAIPPMRPEPNRDHYGRYLIDGQAWTRATTVVGTLKDLNGLMEWKRRKVLAGVAANPQLLTQYRTELDEIADDKQNWRAAKEAKDALKNLCDLAADAAGANKGSKAGTEAHTLTEYADAGRLDEVKHLATESELRDLQAYLAACEKASLVRPPEFIERIVINSTVQSAGTLDRLVYLPDGRLVVADVKSQQSVDFGFLEMCTQLAQYANADGMLDPDTGDLEQMPEELDRSVGIVMHAPVGSGRCDIFLIDLEVGWEAARIAHRVRQLRKESKSYGRLYLPPAAAPAPRPVTELSSTRLLRLIADAGHPQALVGLWEDPAAKAIWTEQHTQAAKARKAQLAAEGVAA